MVSLRNWICLRAVEPLVMVSLVAVIASAHPLTLQSGEPSHPLSKLQFGTGWLMLGFFDTADKDWATVLKHKIGKSILPVPGEILEIAREHPIIIMDFQLKGEASRLLSPAGQKMEKRHFTGLSLPPDSRVKVEEVDREDVIGTSQAIWVRVVAVR